MAADFPTEYMEGRRQWSKIFKMLQENTSIKVKKAKSLEKVAILKANAPNIIA